MTLFLVIVMIIVYFVLRPNAYLVKKVIQSILRIPNYVGSVMRIVQGVLLVAMIVVYVMKIIFLGVIILYYYVIILYYIIIIFV